MIVTMLIDRRVKRLFAVTTAVRRWYLLLAVINRELHNGKANLPVTRAICSDSPNCRWRQIDRVQGSGLGCAKMSSCMTERRRSYG